MTCAHCGRPAACYGSYEDQPFDYACSRCCGHGNEDGRCWLVSAHTPLPLYARRSCCWHLSNDHPQYDPDELPPVFFYRCCTCHRPLGVYADSDYEAPDIDGTNYHHHGASCEEPVPLCRARSM
jgi:hypothetical protein